MRSNIMLKLEFGNPKSNQVWEVYSPTHNHIIAKRYWQTYCYAVQYAKSLSEYHELPFMVRWCQPEPVKPIKRLTSA